MDLKDAEHLLVHLMNEHGLIKEGWFYRFGKSKRQFGSCNYLTRRITMSIPLTRLNSEEYVKNTILHEIAHALTPYHRHDSVWKRKAIEIGCDGSRCYSDNVIRPSSDFIATCPNCGKRYSYRRRRRNVACGECCRTYNSGKYDTRFVLQFQRKESN